MIEVFFQDIDVIDTVDSSFYNNWLERVSSIENKEIGDVSLIFTSDEYLLKVNQDYLDHDYYTDIITFDYSEDGIISGDLFISIDRIIDNAKINSVTFVNELNRVIVHGVLHLCGYKDKSESEELLMREKENQMLSLLN